MRSAGIGGKETLKDGYLTVGFMTLGEIALGLENFPDDEPALTFVLFFFLFIIVIVMMNVLIAHRFRFLRRCNDSS